MSQHEGPVDFPSETFGVCPICGGTEADQTVGLTDADAPARDLLGDGTILYWYDDLWMCEICMNDRKQDKVTMEAAEQIGEDKQFLAEAGFIQMPTDGNLEPSWPYGINMYPMLDDEGNIRLDDEGNVMIADGG